MLERSDRNDVLLPCLSMKWQRSGRSGLLLPHVRNRKSLPVVKTRVTSIIHGLQVRILPAEVSRSSNWIEHWNILWLLVPRHSLEQGRLTSCSFLSSRRWKQVSSVVEIRVTSPVRRCGYKVAMFIIKNSRELIATPPVSRVP